MDKEIFSMGIALFLVALFFVPVIYFEIQNRRTSNKFTTRVKELAKKNNVSPTLFDSWRDRYAIGLDENRSKIFYLRTNEDHEETLLTDLNELRHCSILKDETKNGLPTSKAAAIRTINLVLTYQNAKKPIKILTFFSDKSGDSLKDAAKMAEKWSKIINSRVKVLKKMDDIPAGKPPRPVVQGTR